MPDRDSTTPEIWKPIPFANGFYEASTWGRIRSAEKHVFIGGTLYTVIPPRVIKARPNRKTGYPTVSIFKEPATPTTCSVHQLVADAFIGPRPTRYDINHIDGTRTNNRPENLA